jgi:hypothetical protein
MMRSCPGCGLTLTDDAIFCPTCGWQKAATPTQSTPSVAPITSGSTPVEVGPATPSATSDSDPKSVAMKVRMVLALALLPVVVIVEAIAWFVALPHLRLNFVFLHGRVDFSGLRGEIGWLLLIVCTSISIAVTGWLYPPLAKEYRPFFERQFAAPRRTPATPGKLAVGMIVGAIWLVIVLVRMRASH